MPFKIEVAPAKVHLPFRLWIKDLHGDSSYIEFSTFEGAATEMHRMLNHKSAYMGIALVELSDFALIEGRWIVTGCVHASWGDYR